MADDLTLPGTGMKITERYEETHSRRLDHPDLGDVSKTAYAVGVIKEFKKASDDPALVMAAAPLTATDYPLAVMVESMVKVEVEGVGTSDFIPIFCHPKEQYWDGAMGPVYVDWVGDIWKTVKWLIPASENTKATKCNEDNGYFEKAWQSFRVGDEVIVMLTEGKPVAVIGFADCVPRIGEDIIKFDFEGGFWWKCSDATRHADDKGPDGLDLGLKLACERVTKRTASSEQVGYARTLATFFGVNCIDDWTVSEYSDQGAYGTAYCGQVESVTRYVKTQFYHGIVYEHWQVNNVRTIYHYLVPVGPVLYLIEYYISTFKYSWTGDIQEGSILYDPVVHYYLLAINNVYGASPDRCVNFPYPGNVAAADATAAGVPRTDEPYSGEPQELPEDYMGASIGVYATLYSKEKYEEAKNFVVPGEISLPQSQRIPPGFVRCAYGLDSLINGDGSFRDAKKDKEDLDLKVFTRPHTKEELQAAGMWPAANA